jgi:Cell Wall Hydrolase
MAASIQWSGTLQSPQQLARIIQGEAATPAGQFAVAATMYNRMSPLGAGVVVGGGSNNITEVVTPSQFNGMSSAPPSENAQALANELWNGQAPQGGTTGNSLFYANPTVPGTAAWAQGLNNGGANVGGEGNLFSDRQGAPSANFAAPQYGGVAAAGDGPSDSHAYDPDSGMFDGNSQVGASPGGAPDGTTTSGDWSNTGTPAGPGSGGDGSSVSIAPDGQAPVQDDLTKFQVAGVNAPIGASVTKDTSKPTKITTDNTQSQQDGAPLDIKNAPDIGVKAANTLAQSEGSAADTIGKSVSGAGQAIQSAEGSFAAAGTSWLGSLFSAFTDILVRGGFITLGLVILVGAFVFFYAESKKTDTPIVVPVPV